MWYIYIVFYNPWNCHGFPNYKRLVWLNLFVRASQSYFTVYENCLVSFKYTFFVLCSPLTVRVFIFDVCLFRKLEYNYIHRKNYWRRQHGDRTSMFVIICTLTHLSQLMMGGVCERNFNAQTPSHHRPPSAFVFYSILQFKYLIILYQEWFRCVSSPGCWFSVLCWPYK